MNLAEFLLKIGMKSRTDFEQLCGFFTQTEFINIAKNGTER